MIEELKHIKFPSIGQFRNVVTEVREWAEKTKSPNPTLKFTGTVKLHGTNISVCSTGEVGDDRLWLQSREKILSVDLDSLEINASLLEPYVSYWNEMMAIIRTMVGISTKEDTILIFGEWAGRGVHKNKKNAVGILKLDPALYVVGIALVNRNDIQVMKSGQEIIPWRWLTQHQVETVFELMRKTSLAKPPIHNIYDFKTYEIEIDFTNPELAQNRLVELTNEVETECPVSKALGITGIGEGIVWSTPNFTARGRTMHEIRFKVKGDEHAVSRVTKLASVDVEKLESLTALIDSCLTENRLMQGFDYLKNELGLKRTLDAEPQFKKWVIKDILKEEKDTIEKNGFDKTEVMQIVARRASQWYRVMVT